MDRLLENKLIDQEKYARLKRVLVTLDEKKHEKMETKDLMNYVTSNK